jgi:membrane protein CcdC involved in cytochrome C biogenesis
MFDWIARKNPNDIVTIAIIIAIILGIIISIFFIVVEKESYSSIYIIPDSIAYDNSSGSVMYTYGVISSESGTMDYNLNVYLDDTLIKTKQFSLNPKEILDERDRIILPTDLKYPSKISLVLTTTTSKEEVHFWLTG